MANLFRKRNQPVVAEKTYLMIVAFCPCEKQFAFIVDESGTSRKFQPDATTEQMTLEEGDIVYAAIQHDGYRWNIVRVYPADDVNPIEADNLRNQVDRFFWRRWVASNNDILTRYGQRKQELEFMAA